MGKLAPIQIDIHLERGNLHGLPQIVGRSIRLHAAAAGGQTGDVDVYLLFVHLCSAVAHSMNNAPPVGIVPVPGTLHQGRLGYGFRRFFSFILRAASRHMHGDELGHPLSVLHDVLGQFQHHMGQSLLECVNIFRSFQLHAGCPIRHHQNRVIRAHVSINGDAVKRTLHSGLDAQLQHIAGNARIRRDKTQHGRHAGIDHARPLAAGADAHGFTLHYKLNGNDFLLRVAGHHGLGHLMPLVTGKPLRQFRKLRVNAHHRHWQANHAGGTYGHFCRLQPQKLRNAAAFAPGVLHPTGSGAGVRVPAVRYDGADISFPEMLPAHLHAGGLHAVGRKRSCGHAGFRGINQGQVQTRGCRLLDAAAYGAPQKSPGRANAPVNRNIG